MKHCILNRLLGTSYQLKVVMFVLQKTSAVTSSGVTTVGV